MNLMQVSRLTEAEARAHLESLRWPNGPECAHCESADVLLLGGKATRPGLYKCRACRKQFTVTVGTIFEGSKLPLRTWLMAFAILASAKKGVSAKQLERALGIGCYQTAWHLAHRIRHAMRSEPLKRLLMGTIESDEVYIGGKPRFHGKYIDGKHVNPHRVPKTPVLTLVERDGELRAQTLERVTGESLKDALHKNVDQSARLLTDEAGVYKKVGMTFKGGHECVMHSAYEYARGLDVHVNTAESFHSLMRRGLIGSFHHVSRRHLHRYVDEFAWKWNHRRETDAERTVAALKQTEGRRLAYKNLAPKAKPA